MAGIAFEIASSRATTCFRNLVSLESRESADSTCLIFGLFVLTLQRSVQKSDDDFEEF